jgi:peptidoglycan/LPS O-acetylase OafA/YrhL
VLALADFSYRFVELPFRKGKRPALPDGGLRVARAALLVGVLAIVAFVGWSGLFARGGSHPQAAAASTVAAATVSASLEPAGEDPSNGGLLGSSPSATR